MAEQSVTLTSTLAEKMAPLRAWLWLVPVLAAAAAYAIAPRGALVWDDQIVARQQMAAIDELRDVFVPPAEIPQWTYAYYRPMVVLSYLADQAFFGRGAVAGPHTANVLYHVLVTLFVWLLARRVLRGLPAAELSAVLVATLFAVHPIHTESVSWITGRSDVLAALFLLPSLLCLLRWRDYGSIPALLAAPVLFLGALLAKEVALTGLVLAPLLLWLAPRTQTALPPTRSAVAFTWAAVAVALIGAAGMYLSLRVGAGTEGANLEAKSSVEIASQALRALGYYVGKLVLPWPQSNFVPWSSVPAAGPAAAILACAAVVAACAVLPWRQPAARAAFAGIVWIAVTLAPAVAVALTAIAATPVAERYLYLPSVGLALALGAVFCRVDAGAPRRIAIGALLALVGLAGAATVARGMVWQNDLRLWSDAILRAGDHAVPLLEYGKAQFQAGEPREAEQSFQRAREVAELPRLRATALYNLGAISTMRGDAVGAEQLFVSAIDTDPSYALAYYGLGRAWFEQGMASASKGDTAAALSWFARARERQERALRLNPTHIGAYLELARVLASTGEILQAGGDAVGAARDFARALDLVDTAAALEPTVRERPEVQALTNSLLAALRRARSG